MYDTSYPVVTQKVGLGALGEDLVTQSGALNWRIHERRVILDDGVVLKGV
jgi:hypothetical protein